MKDDHGKKSTSTSLLYNTLLDEEVLPDHLLPEDSELKKKRNAQRFFEELRYAIFIESIRIHQYFIDYMTRKKENLRKEKQFDVREFLQNLTYTPIAAAAKSIPLEEQKQLFKTIEAKFQFLSTYLDTKINEVKDILQEKLHAITTTKSRTDLLRQHLAKKWKKHFSKMIIDPELNLNLKIAIPDQFIALASTKNFNGEIHLDKKIFKQLFTTLEKGFDTNKSLQEIYNSLQEQYLNASKQQMLNQLSFMPSGEREKWIELQLKDPQVKKILDGYFWQDILNNATFKDQLLETFELENKLSKLQAEITAYQNYQHRLSKMKTDFVAIAKGQLADLELILTKQSLDNAQFKQLKNVDHLMEECFDQSNLIDNELKQELDTIEKITAETDNFFTELAALEVQGENMLKTGISKNEEASMLITFKTLHQETEEFFAEPKIAIERAAETQELETEKLEHSSSRKPS